MGQDFERNLGNAFNKYFEKHRFDRVKGVPMGIAFRDTQSKYQGQKLDVFIDNPHIGIECKKVKFSSTNKLYFSQHFSKKEVEGREEKVHQVETISDYLLRSDRKGFLAIRVSRGRGKPAKGYIIEWEYVKDLYYDEECKGIDLRTLDEKVENHDCFMRIPRPGSDWEITEELWRNILDFL